MKSRIIFLDFIRALAIILILMYHLPDYLGNYQIFEIFVPYFTNFGWGLFIFLSGYAIFLNNSSIHATEDILAFYKKRAIRIFPLYLIALFVFFVIFGLVIQIFGRNLGMDFGNLSEESSNDTNTFNKKRVVFFPYSPESAF